MYNFLYISNIFVPPNGV